MSQISRLGAGLGFRLILATQLPTWDVIPRQCGYPVAKGIRKMGSYTIEANLIESEVVTTDYTIMSVDN